MSDENASSLLSKVRHGAFGILGSVVALWVAVQLILQIWWVIATCGGVALIVVATVWWWRAHYRW